MRYDREENRQHNEEREPRWLHNHHQGYNSDRGNYTIDSHFNRSRGDMGYSDFGATDSFRPFSEEDQRYHRRRMDHGGAHYAGDDYTSDRKRTDNPYGMTFTPRDDYNSGRHYDARADYSDRDYDDIRRGSGREYSSAYDEDQNYGHDIRRGGGNENWARGSIGDYEGYRRHERRNPNYDNDYSGGSAGRNYSEGRPHYGEGRYNSELERWSGQGDERYERYMRERDRRSNR